MPKKNRRDRARRPRQHPHPVRTTRADSAEDQQLLQTLRSGLRSGEPLQFLAAVSGFLEVTDPRSRDPFDRGEPRPGRSELIESFIGTQYAETTEALTAIRALTADEVASARIVRELAARRHPLPDWLAGLGDARIDPDVWLMTHVLGDGDDYLLGVTLPTGQPLSALVYVDHNLGTVVKDAFLIPEPLEDVAIKIGTLIEDPDQSLTRTDPATARAMIEYAIDHGSRLYPPLTSDSWPMCRPLVEWMTRMLPGGGAAPEIRKWSEEELAAISADFFSSRFGVPFDREDERALLEDLLWFGSSYTTGDPFQWSLVTVEILLLDWFPRKIMAKPAYLQKLPDLLRAWIRYCHDHNGIRADLTAETLDAVDQYEPEYRRLISGNRPSPAAALANAVLGLDPIEELSDEELRLEYLSHDVGGVSALMDLDDDPLPDEELDWTGIPAEIHPAVQAIVAAYDDRLGGVLDVEHRTAMRRFLARAARNDPKLFRRKSSPVRGAAAAAWVIATANRTTNSYAPHMQTKDLLAHFGITGSVSDRAQSLIRAAGIDLSSTYGWLRLGDPALLVSRRRRELIAQRDRGQPAE